IVELDLERDLPLPKNTVAAIATTDFLGDKNVELIFNGSCSGSNCAVSGDFLRPGSKSVLASMTGGAEEVGEYVEQVTSRVNVLIDSLGKASGDPNSAFGKTMSEVGIILENVKLITAKTNALLAVNSAKINSVVEDVNTLSNTIKSKDEELSRIIANVDQLTQNLAKLDLNGTLQSANGAVSSLNTTLGSADQAVGDLQKILAAIKEGEGTLGQLVTNDDLYNQLNKTMKDLDLLLEDFRLNPARYTTILKKKRPQYAAPDGDN
ncbi:MAG: hypothetical protein AAFP82_20490, partial [Bacteroidota bacterium]